MESYYRRNVVFIVIMAINILNFAEMGVEICTLLNLYCYVSYKNSCIIVCISSFIKIISETENFVIEKSLTYRVLQMV